MEKDYLILKPVSASRPSGEWNDDDYDLLANGEGVGRIFKANATPIGWPRMWTLIFPHHEGARHRTAMRRCARPRWRRCERKACLRAPLKPIHSSLVQSAWA